jgi:cell division septation protein DedD
MPSGGQAKSPALRACSCSSTRVAIGPMVDRDDAIKLERELEKRYGMDVIVVVFGQ